MSASTCSCRAYVGERHWRSCALFPAVRQPLPQMKGHPSLYRRPGLSEPDKARIQHRIDNLEGCNDDGCQICWPASPFAEADDV